MLDAFRPFIVDTKGQIKAIHTTVGTLQAMVHADLESAKTQIGEELHAIRHSLGAEITHLTKAVGRLPRPASVPAAAESSAAQHNSGAASPGGHCFDYDNRAKMCAERTSPSVGGMPPTMNPAKFSLLDRVFRRVLTLPLPRVWNCPNSMAPTRNCGNAAARITSSAGTRPTLSGLLLLLTNLWALRLPSWSPICINTRGLSGTNSSPWSSQGLAATNIEFWSDASSVLLKPPQSKITLLGSQL
jgi:hypothetical protein